MTRELKGGKKALNTINQKILVDIQSSDDEINQMKLRIEKLTHFEIWVGKALVLLEKYLSTLNSLDSEPDEKVRGLRIQDLECYFMTSVFLYLRCFQDKQKKLHLKIHRITKDPHLIKCYNGLYSLRNDEYTHWQGLRSKLKVKYYLEVETERTLKPCNPSFFVDWEDSIGAKDDENLSFERIKHLYTLTLKRINEIRGETYDALLKRLFTEEVFKSSDLLNENGVSIIKKN